MYLKGRPCQQINTETLASKTEVYIASNIAYIRNEAAMIVCLNDKKNGGTTKSELTRLIK